MTALFVSFTVSDSGTVTGHEINHLLQLPWLLDGRSLFSAQLYLP